MPLDAITDINENNINFIATLLYGGVVDDVNKSFPYRNYRLRLKGLTEFSPYLTESPRLNKETNEEYESRLLLSGRVFGEEEILLDDLVHSENDINNLNINSRFYDGQIPRTILYLDECNKSEIIRSANLNNLNYVQSLPPDVVFPVDLSSESAGYEIFRRTSSINKVSGTSALIENVSGWYNITGYSNSEIDSILDGGGIVGFTDDNYYKDPDDNISYSGYKPFQNELFTSYKIINRSVLNSPPSLKDDLKKDRKVDVRVDPSKSYSLERRVTRDSNDTTSDPPAWEIISSDATFPYVDNENLSDFINTNVNFEVTGVYDVIEPTGVYADGRDFFEVDLLDDWGKTDIDLENQITNREKTQELTFRSGESIKVVQRATSKDMGAQRDNIQWGSFDLSFNPHSTGISGCVTGSNNEKNFYQLEYQLIPKGSLNKKLHYEKASAGHGLAVGDSVFLNTGQEGGVYSPVKANIFGEHSNAISTSLYSNQSFLNIQPIQDAVSDIGPSYEMGMSGVLHPEVVPYSVNSGDGYSYFSSGEKYLVVPKGGYSSHNSETPMSYDSAGERRDVFFQGEQNTYSVGANGTFENDAEYALTEYRTYDNVMYSDARFQYGKEREVRISQKSLCLGDSSSDLPDDYLGGIVPSYILDSRREHTTAMQLKNANILNIDSSDGSIKISNLKNNRHEFREKCNLFFEKEYTASLTILATGQKQDVSPLKQYITGDKVYYLERDIYIDSDINSQANTESPEFRSDSNEASLSPFSTGPFTPNPQSLGQEKLYLTQTHHNDTSFPYNDFEFYNYQPTIKEEFTYSNHSASVIDDFLITNGSVERVYRPGSFDCFISPLGHEEVETEGYSVLMNTGYHDTQTSDSFNVGIGSVSFSKVDVSFTPSNKGSYHEIQTRANSSSDWVSVSPVVEAVEEEVAQTVTDVYPVSSSSASDYRVLEWFPSSILSKYNGISLPNESPDSLILKSEGSRVYDISKAEHSIGTEGAVALVDDDPFTTDEKVISFPGADTAYLSIPSHRSFNIQSGEFSFEFWIKQPSYGGAIDNIIFSRDGAYSLYLSGANKLRFDYVDEHGDTVKVFEKGIDNFSSSNWKHVALCKVMASREKFRLYLYIDGEAQELTPQDPTPLRYLECTYDDYSGISNKPLVIGKGLSGKLYQLRFYIGKSLYRGDFTVSETEFTKETNQRKYKILKFIYNRKKGASNWIINRNQFENVGPPSDYLADEAAKSSPPKEVPEESTYHTYEWLNLNSMPGPLDNRRTRALVNYLNGYAYNAPNNPHINKNYEGKAITKDSQIDEVVADNYFFKTSEGGSRGDPPAAPYLYEFLGNSSIGKIRFSQKGGADTKSIKQLSEAGVSYSNGSRLRITKYVYRLYTKTAVVVGDIGYKNSRSSQSGWAYQLQYSTDGSIWTDTDHTDASEDNLFFYNDIEGLNSNSYENIDYVTILSRLVLKSNITEKYHPEDIQFRIEKRQIISLGGSSLSADVIKKVNFLPVIVNIPTTGTLLDLTQKSAAGDADSGQGHHYADSDSSVVRVYLDSSTDYVLYKDSQEEILLTENADDPLQIKSMSMNAVQHADADGNILLNQEVLDGTSVNTYESLEDGKPYAVGGLTGITISGSHIGSASSNLDKLEAVKSVIGVKPSGLLISRVEKSFGSIDFGGNIYSDAEETKVFLTPEITGSHLDELEDFAVYTPNDSSTEESLIQFTCRSCITGEGDPIETGVSGVSYTPAYKFFNDPIMKGKFNITAEDDGKTFLCSGSQASGLFVSPPSSLDLYTFDIVNIGGDAIEILRSGEGHNSVLKHSVSASEAATVTVESNLESSLGTSSGVDTILPDIVVPAEANESLIIVEGIDSLSISDSNVSSSCIAVNISSGLSHVHNPSLTHSDGTPAGASLGSLSGVSFNSSAARVNQLDSGVLVVEHDKIVLTPDDAYMTGVIDTSSTLVLPKGLNNGEHVTLLNATDDEVKTVSELNYKIDSKSVDYIPKETARKFTFSSSASSWSSSDVDVIKYNQLDVGSSDDNKVFIHNEDVDVRVTDGSLSTGFNFNVVRSQINQIHFDDLRSQSYETPLLRVFVNGYLKYTAPPGVLGVKVVKQSYGWEFKKIEVLRQGEIIVDPDAHGKIFQFQPKAYGDELAFHFVKSDSYPSNFEFFVCSLKVVPDLNITFKSEDDEYKFNEQEEEGSYTAFKGAFTSRKSFFRVSRKTSISGGESGDFTSRRFFVSMVGADKKEASNKGEFTQPNDTKGRVVINRNENFSLELPSIDKDFNIENGLDLTFVNASETDSQIDDDEVKAFSAYNYKYKDESYESQEKNLHGTGPKLSHNDFVVLDGSLSNVALREFYEGDEDTADYHKYSEDSSSLILPKDYLISFSGSSGTSTFRLPKHELVSNQKITFNGGRITYADYYYETASWNSDWINGASFNGAITSSVNISSGETFLVYDTGLKQYFLYEYVGVDNLAEIDFTIPEDLVGNFAYTNTFNFGVGNQTEDDDTAPGPIRKGQMFAYIKKGSGNGTAAISNVDADSVHDLYTDSLGSSSVKDNDDAIPFTFSFDEFGDLREQTFFVKVINQNEFYLYEDRDLSTDQVTFADADDFTLLSTEFNVHTLNHRKLSIVNLGNNSENVKSYFDETAIVSSLESERSVDLFSQEGAVYSQGDVTPSGVHILSGLDDMTEYDTLNINSLQASGNHIVTSGVFHAHGDLNDNSFNDKYYINAGLDKLEITNTTPTPDTTYTIKKNRIAKHTNDDTYQVQDQSTANRDVIYYPKDEIHIPNRVNLGKTKKDKSFDYNFVFYDPVSHNEDLVIVLPDSWSGGLGRVAVVNAHNRAISVVNFSRTISSTVNANSVLFMEDATDYSDSASYSFYNGSTLNGYTISIAEATVEKKGNKEEYYKSNEEDIILDFDTHAGKKIFVDGDVNFLRPYLYKTDGTNDYLDDGDSNKFSPSADFAVELVNVSTSPVLISINGDLLSSIEELPSRVYGKKRDGKFHSLIPYSIEIEDFIMGEGEGSGYFKHITPVEGDPLTISHGETQLTSTNDYLVFGKELSLSFDVHYDEITASEAASLNLEAQGLGAGWFYGETDWWVPIDLEDSAHQNKYFKIVGIGGENISTVNIINTVYENIKIKSVNAQRVGSTETSEKLGDVILSYFSQSYAETMNTLSLSDSNDEGIDAEYTNFVPENYLNKSKVLSLSIRSLVEYNEEENNTYLSVFKFDDDDDPQGIDQNNIRPFWVTSEVSSKVKLLKKGTFQISPEATAGSSFYYAFTDANNVLLPSRKDLSGFTSDIYFTIINASRVSSTLTSPDGVDIDSSASVSIGSDSVVKIKYSGGSFSNVTSGSDGAEIFGSQNAIYSSPSGVFVATNQNAEASALAIHPDVDKITIINNTGGSFYLDHFTGGGTVGGASTFAMPRSTYAVLKRDSATSFIALSKDIPLLSVGGGKVEISSSLYKNGVVLFDLFSVKLLNVTDIDFFPTTFVPLVREEEFSPPLEQTKGIKRGTDFGRSSSSRSVGYSVTRQDSDREDVGHSGPVEFTVSSGSVTRVPKTPICYMYEFILDESVKDKIILSTKEYDYVFKHGNTSSPSSTAPSFGFCLYNRSGDGVSFRKLTEGNKTFKRSSDSTEEALLTGSTKNRLMLSCTQVGYNDPTITELQTYIDIVREIYSPTLYKNFYLNKSHYDNKIIIFKDPFDVIYSSKKDNTVIGNISSEPCYTFISKLGLLSDSDAVADHDDGEVESGQALTANRSARAETGGGIFDASIEILRPKHLISSIDKILVGTQPADIEFSGDPSGLKIINASSRVVDIKTSFGSDVVNKLYSSERADYTDATTITHTLCPRSNRYDWFVKLMGVDIPHLQRNLDYYDQKEDNAAEILDDPTVGVEYSGAGYRFSNIFRTNRYAPAIFGRGEGLSGYESISEYDDPYAFGITLYGSRKGELKKVFYDRNPKSYVLNGLKLPWDMPAKVLAYALSTGHERLCRCKEFNERTGMVTLTGIEPDKYYILSDFDDSYYNFVHSAVRVEDSSHYGVNSYRYLDVESGTSLDGDDNEIVNPNSVFIPEVEYNGKVYWPANKFEGVEGITDYKIRYNYYATLKGSHFSSGSIDEGDEELIDAKEEDMDSQNQSLNEKRIDENDPSSAFDPSKTNITGPTWSKVSSNAHKNDFLNGKITALVAAGANNNELIYGKKLKDIDGVFKKDYFEFKVPKHPELSYFESFTDVRSDGSDDRQYIFKVYFEGNSIDSPGYEYEVQSSLKYNNTIGKDLLAISLSDGDAMPFVAQGEVGSLNLQSFSDDYQEYAIKTANSNLELNSVRQFMQMAERDGRFSLKNNQGYSFVPFGTNPRDGGAAVGMGFNIDRDKGQYSSVRLRLKKLADRRLTFENLEKDSKKGAYLTENTKQADLKYILSSEVSSISYHDIARPGGVLRMTYPEWKTVGPSSSGEYPKLSTSSSSTWKIEADDPVAHGDAIVFKESNASIVGGKPYFVRVEGVNNTGNTTIYTITLLKIYTLDTALDSVNSVNSSIAEDSKFKIVNYFDTGTHDDETYRKVGSKLAEIYPDPDEAGLPVTTANYPVIIGPKTFFLEPALTNINDTNESAYWGDKGWMNLDDKEDLRLRVNLELSATLPHWTGEGQNTEGWSSIIGLEGRYCSNYGDNDYSHWSNEVDRRWHLFKSFRNVLFRPNTQIERVFYSKDDKTITFNAKLNANTEYRYILKASEFIKSITLNGVSLNGQMAPGDAAICDIVYNEKEDLKIVLKVLSEDDYINSKKVGIDNKGVDIDSLWFWDEDEIRRRIYENLCIIESADYIDTDPSDTPPDASDGGTTSNLNYNKLDYFDYQIPSLNDFDGRDSSAVVFKNLHHTYYTEGYDPLLTYSQKGENLTVPDGAKPLPGAEFKAGLFYDMGMPATCKYIYPQINTDLATDIQGFSVRANFESTLLFAVTFHYWKGFNDRFGSEDEFHKVKPIRIKFDLEHSDDGETWTTAKSGMSVANTFKVVVDGLTDFTKKYRMAITNVEIEYKSPTEDDANARARTNIDYLRVPFKWLSSIFSSDVSGDGEEDSGSGLFYHSMSMTENPNIKRCVSFPKEGLTKLGEFHFMVNPQVFYESKALYGFYVPVTRLYMFNFKHNLKANYKDPINRGGISKVIITDRGDYYRTLPTLTIPVSDSLRESSSFREAKLKAIIEGGKLKHVEIQDAGAGYANLKDSDRERVEQYRADIIPLIIHTMKIGLVAEENREDCLDFVDFSDIPLLDIYDVNIKGNEASLTPVEQEVFGLTFPETEAIAEWQDVDEYGTNTLAKSEGYPSVDFMKGSAEDDETWSDIQAQADRITAIKNFRAATINETKNHQAFTLEELEEEERSEPSKSENPYVDGLYQEAEEDESSYASSHVGSTLVTNDGGLTYKEYEAFATVDEASAIALANNSSIADYRVIDNSIRNNPWISSFSREQNPSLPESFGVTPSTEVTAEVFNSYARAINKLHLLRVEAPVYARIRRYKQVEYRYLNSPKMAGLTFESPPQPYDAGDADTRWGENVVEEYLTFEKKSMINYIVFLDPNDGKTKIAHFSAFENNGRGKLREEGKEPEDAKVVKLDGKGNIITGGANIVEYKQYDSSGSPIWDDIESELRNTEQGKKFKIQDNSYSPNDIGLPNTVNIPGELGVYCNPAQSYDAGGHRQPVKDKGIPLPAPINRRAFAYGGELVYQSEIYDVSDQALPGGMAMPVFEAIEGDTLVDIRGSEYIKAAYQNEIVFGCQTAGKPFLSAFLRTTKVWTDYEVVASPEFTSTLPAGLKEKYKPEESIFRATLSHLRVICSEEKIGTVEKEKGYHSVCEDGRQMYRLDNSYEDLFNLSEGQDVIGPRAIESEVITEVEVKAKGQLFINPEFDLSLAVYAANEYILAVRKGIHDPNGYVGPCIHYCMPGQTKTLHMSNDPLIFDLKK